MTHCPDPRGGDRRLKDSAPADRLPAPSAAADRAGSEAAATRDGLRDAKTTQIALNLHYLMIPRFSRMNGSAMCTLLSLVPVSLGETRGQVRETVTRWFCVGTPTLMAALVFSLEQ